VGLLGGPVALLGVLIGMLGGLVALRSAGMPDLPGLALLVKLSLTGGGLLLQTMLALGGLAFPVPGFGQLGFERPAALPEAREPSQVAELVGELPAWATAYWACPAASWASASACWIWGSRGMVAITRADWSRCTRARSSSALAWSRSTRAWSSRARCCSRRSRSDP